MSCMEKQPLIPWERGVTRHCKSRQGIGFATLHDTDAAARCITSGQAFDKAFDQPTMQTGMMHV